MFISLSSLRFNLFCYDLFDNQTGFIQLVRQFYDAQRAKKGKQISIFQAFFVVAVGEKLRTEPFIVVVVVLLLLLLLLTLRT